MKNKCRFKILIWQIMASTILFSVSLLDKYELYKLRCLIMCMLSRLQYSI